MNIYLYVVRLLFNTKKFFMNSKQILVLNNFYVGTKIIKFQTYANNF